jgi:hypothetical protein
MQKPGVIWLTTLLAYNRKMPDYHLEKKRGARAVPVRGTERMVNALSASEMEQKSRQDLIRLIRRLYRQGMNVEQIKQWFVHGIPNALTVVNNPLPRRGSRPHNVGATGHAPVVNRSENG